MSKFRYHRLPESDKKRVYDPLLKFLTKIFVQILFVLHITPNYKIKNRICKNINAAEERLRKMYKIKTNKVVSREVYYKKLGDICKMEIREKQLKFLVNKILARIEKSGGEKSNLENIIIEEVKKDVGSYLIDKIREGFDKSNYLDVKMYNEIGKDLNRVLVSSYNMLKDEKYIETMSFGVQKRMRKEIKEYLKPFIDKGSRTLINIKRYYMEMYGLDIRIKLDEDSKQAIIKAIDEQDMYALHDFFEVLDLDNLDKSFFTQKIKECAKKGEIKFLESVINTIKPEILKSVFDGDIRGIIHNNSSKEIDSNEEDKQINLLEVNKEPNELTQNKTVSEINELGMQFAMIGFIKNKNFSGFKNLVKKMEYPNFSISKAHASVEFLRDFVGKNMSDFFNSDKTGQYEDYMKVLLDAKRTKKLNSINTKAPNQISENNLPGEKIKRGIDKNM